MPDADDNQYGQTEKGRMLSRELCLIHSLKNRFLFPLGIARPFADADDVLQVDRFHTVGTFYDDTAVGNFLERPLDDAVRTGYGIDDTIFSFKLLCQFYHSGDLLVLFSFFLHVLYDGGSCRLSPVHQRDNEKEKNGYPDAAFHDLLPSPVPHGSVHRDFRRNFILSYHMQKEKSIFGE